MEERETIDWFDQVRKGLKSATFVGTSWTAAGSIANGLVGALSSAILARYLGLEDFGTLVLIISLMNLVVDVAEFGFGNAIVKFGATALERKDNAEFHRVASVVFRWKLLLGSVIILLSVFFLNEILRNVFHHVDGQIEYYFQLSLVAAAVSIVAGIFPPILQVHRLFRQLAIVIGSRYIAKFFLLLLCMVLTVHWSVELGIGVEIAAAICFLAAGLFSSPLRTFSLRLRDQALQKDVFHFNKWLSLHQVIIQVGGRADVFFLGLLADARALGLYGAAAKISGVLQLATSAYHAVLLPELSAAGDHQAIEKQRRSSRFVGVVLIAGIGILASLANPVVVSVFGPEFSDTGTLLQVMAVGLAFHVLAHPFMAALLAMNRSVAYPLVSGLSMTTFVLCNALLVPVYGALGSAIAFSAGGLVTFLTGFVLSRVFVTRGNRPVSP
jgi:O-antigen/teichoic acid export membrane protein